MITTYQARERLISALYVNAIESISNPRETNVLKGLLCALDTDRVEYWRSELMRLADDADGNIRALPALQAAIESCADEELTALADAAWWTKAA